jgi:hypothetical protein
MSQAEGFVTHFVRQTAGQCVRVLASLLLFIEALRQLDLEIVWALAMRDALHS